MRSAWCEFDGFSDLQMFRVVEKTDKDIMAEEWAKYEQQWEERPANAMTRGIQDDGEALEDEAEDKEEIEQPAAIKRPAGKMKKSAAMAKAAAMKKPAAMAKPEAEGDGKP